LLEEIPMKMNPWKVSTIALSCTLAAVVGAGAIPNAHAEQPNMSEALNRMQEAKGALDRALDDKGGHRVKALGLMGQAIGEVQQGIEYAKTHR
jgi:hypothetical protein